MSFSDSFVLELGKFPLFRFVSGFVGNPTKFSLSSYWQEAGKSL